MGQKTRDRGWWGVGCFAASVGLVLGLVGPAPAASASFAVSDGVITGQLVAVSVEDVVGQIAAASRVALEWTGSPGCGRIELAFDGLPVAEVLSRVLESRRMSFVLRFRTLGTTNHLHHIVVHAPDDGPQACAPTTEEQPAPAMQPSDDGFVPASPAEQLAFIERVNGLAAPAKGRARELLTSLLHGAEDVGVRAAAFEAVRQIDLAPDAIDRALADPASKLRLAGLRAVAAHPSGAGDWRGVLATMAAGDADEAVRDLALSVAEQPESLPNAPPAEAGPADAVGCGID